MKKLLVLVLSIAMAIGVMGGTIGAFAEESAKTPEDFTNAENLFVDSVGLLNVYEMDSSMTAYHKNGVYPLDFGMKFAKTAGGYYARVDNMMTENTASGSDSGIYLATSKDVSDVESYYVSATIKVGEKKDWGGLGIVFGRATAEADNNSPLGIWYGIDAQSLYLAAPGNEFQTALGAANDVAVAVGDTIEMAVVVEGANVTAYINDQQVGSTYTVPDTIPFEPAIGAQVKQYMHQYTNFEFKTLETDLPAAQYTVTCYSGGVEIGTIDYTYGEGTALEEVHRAGYNFMGWHFLPDLSDAIVTEIGANVGGDVMVFCEYREATYTITYYDGDTKIENEDWDSVFGYKQYIELPVAEKEGYTFDGWYTNKDFTGEPVEAIQMNTEGNQVFYAKFTAIDDGTPGGDENTDGDKDTNGGGCSSSILAASGLFSVVLAGGAAILFRKRK